MNEFLQGKKTYIGLALALAGFLGIFEYISEGDLSKVLNNGMEIAGIIFAVYGRFKAKPK